MFSNLVSVLNFHIVLFWMANKHQRVYPQIDALGFSIMMILWLIAGELLNA